MVLICTNLRSISTTLCLATISLFVCLVMLAMCINHNTILICLPQPLATKPKVLKKTMVAVYNNELLSWYLLTLKLKETVEDGVSTPQASALYRSEQTYLLEHHEESFSTRQADIFEPGPVPPVSEWVISINEKLEQAQQEDMNGSWGQVSIYRVPQYLKGGDNKAYIPQIVSLGPYHHGKKRHRNMERHKWRSLYQILRRANQDVRIYLDSMKELEERTRACYEGNINLSSNEFVQMMVLDGCFILELFRGAAEGFQQIGYSRNDPVFAMRGSMHSIQRDMIMLENQIPLFVLDRLLGLQLGYPDQKGLVARLALSFFDPLMPTDEPLTKSHRDKLESSEGYTNSFDPLSGQGLHCLDVFRHSLLRRGPSPKPRVWKKQWSHVCRVADKRRQQLTHCVTELRESGVKFKKKKTDRFWDITFSNGLLQIPRLLIHDGTKSLFLNLIAYEQSHLDCGNEITSYVIFMNNMINSTADVGYLHYCGIIEHWLGSDYEVAQLFNKLCQEVVFDINHSYHSRLSAEINKYHDHRWNAWQATLKHTYFNNPWAIISFIAAVVLLILTFAQTIYGVFSYYHPS